MITFLFQIQQVIKTFVSSGTQTDPLQPLAYEHLLLSVLNPVEPIQQRSAPPGIISELNCFSLLLKVL